MNYYVNLDGENDNLFMVTKEFIDWSTGHAHHYSARVLRAWVRVAICLLILGVMVVTCIMAYNTDINNMKENNKTRAEVVAPINK
jgi:hypothetical protein